MSSTIRALKRNIIREQCYKRDGSIKAFADEWRKYCETSDKTKYIENTSKTAKRKGFIRKMLSNMRHKNEI